MLELVLECLATDFPPRDVLQADLVCHTWTRANANGGWRGVARAFGLQPRHKEAAQSWRDALRAVVAPVYRVLQPQLCVAKQRSYLQSRVEWAQKRLEKEAASHVRRPNKISEKAIKRAQVRRSALTLRRSHCTPGPPRRGHVGSTAWHRLALGPAARNGGDHLDAFPRRAGAVGGVPVQPGVSALCAARCRIPHVQNIERLLVRARTPFRRPEGVCVHRKLQPRRW